MTFDYGEAASNNAPNYNLQSEIRGKKYKLFFKISYQSRTKWTATKSISENGVFARDTISWRKNRYL